MRRPKKKVPGGPISLYMFGAAKRTEAGSREKKSSFFR